MQPESHRRLANILLPHYYHLQGRGLPQWEYVSLAAVRGRIDPHVLLSGNPGICVPGGGGVYWWHIRKIVKNRFPYIDTFNHEGPSVISVMRNLTIRVFEHIEITYVMDVDVSIKHTERILRGTSLKKYQHILAGCKALAKGIYGGQWSLGSWKEFSMEQLWDWSNVYAIGILGYPISGSERCTYFDKELWFKLGKIMWRKNRSNF